MKKVISIICALFLTGAMFAQKPFTLPMKSVEDFIPIGVKIPYDNGTGILQKIYAQKSGAVYLCRVRPEKGGYVIAAIHDNSGIVIGGPGGLYMEACERIGTGGIIERFWRLVYVPDRRPVVSALPQL